MLQFSYMTLAVFWKTIKGVKFPGCGSPSALNIVLSLLLEGNLQGSRTAVLEYI